MGDTVRSPINNPLQAFAPSSIQNNVTVLDTANILAVRISAAANYHINDDSGAVAEMPVGVTAISPSVTKITFATPQTVEVMKA